MFTFLSKARKLEISYSEKKTNDLLEEKRKTPQKTQNQKKNKKNNNIQYKHNGPNNLRK